MAEEKKISVELIDEQIVKMDEKIQTEKREKLIQLIINVLVETTMKEFHETKDRAKEISAIAL